MTSMQRLTTVAVILLTGCTFTERCPEGTGKLMQPDGRYGGECVPFPDASTQDAGDSGQTDTDAGPCGGCSGATPLCREDGECVACLSDDECGGQRCDMEAGECVGCLVDADCTTAGAARCDMTTRECAPCDDSGQCEGIAGHGVCGGGECVECTAMDRDACGDNVCDGSTNLCTTRPASSKGLCQECIADDECMDGQLCVQMEFGGTEVGNFCLWRQDASEAPMGDCTTVQPYVRGEEASSIDGITTPVCTLALTTCEALNQYRMRSCTTGAPPTSATDDECGVADLDDGLCRSFGAGNRCTTPCLSDDDCKSGSTCNISATPQYCNF